MKTMDVLLVVIAIACSSCAMANMVIDERNLDNFDDMFLYPDDFDEIEEPGQVGHWIGENIAYKHDAVDYWQTPFETMTRGTGDCEDMALLYINILYCRFGIKADLGMIDDNDRKVKNGGYYNHAVVVLPDGSLISAQWGAVETESLKFVYTFDEIFR